ncbi:acid protease [Obba rivulosa]|uniref:Acid protease n=1 Tax=Obba rivulosa TaxID=1052685 RepID=A0A8E2AWH7_9APHY|nr:acid protease [Obba rivulosa]
MFLSCWCPTAVLLLLALVGPDVFTLARPLRLAERDQPAVQKGVTVPLGRRRVVRRDAASSGLGDFADLFYTVEVQVGNTSTAVNLDTGSSDLWVKSSDCHTTTCRSSTSVAYSATTFQSSGASVDLHYGDSTSGTQASGPVGFDSVGIAGLTVTDQPFAAVNRTNNSAVQYGGAGILGLGFPAQSFVQAAVINLEFNTPLTTDAFVSSIDSLGPVVSRLVQTGAITQPMFSISLQRDTIDVSGHGQLTIGQLPAGVDNSSVTWVPVRLYSPADGGLNPPTFAPDETYPLRWEVPIDAVFLDGQELPASTEQPQGVDSSVVSALIDTGNSLMRGPQDIVNSVLSSVSPAYAADSSAAPVLPCSSAHTLAFQIGGTLFPVDPRDFVSPNSTGDAETCVADNLVATDPPSVGTLFSWSLGDPFLKSNMVVFYYGNLSHPSVDPPRMGFMSVVPSNASLLLQDAISSAQQDGGVFSSTVDVAPTPGASSNTVVPTPPISTGASSATPTSGQGSVSSSHPAAATLPASSHLPNGTSPLRAFGSLWFSAFSTIVLLFCCI